MEMRHLRHFVVVAEEEHFGRASKHLAIVQPALSRQIHEIEAELGVRLFERVGRNVRLTNAGRCFLKDARRVLEDVEGAFCRARLASRGQTGTLTIGFVEGMADTPFLPTVLAEFRQLVPDVALDLRILKSHEQEGPLRSNEMNLGFCYFPPTDLPTLKTATISTTPVKLAVAKGHRLQNKRRIRLRDLQEESFVWYPRPVLPGYYDRIAYACGAGGLSMNIVSEAPTESMVLGLVAVGVGVTFALERGRHYNCVFRDVEDFGVDMPMYAIWRGDDPSPILPKFLAVMRDVFARKRTKRTMAGP